MRGHMNVKYVICSLYKQKLVIFYILYMQLFVYIINYKRGTQNK